MLLLQLVGIGSRTVDGHRHSHALEDGRMRRLGVLAKGIGALIGCWSRSWSGCPSLLVRSRGMAVAVSRSRRSEAARRRL